MPVRKDRGIGKPESSPGDILHVVRLVENEDGIVQVNVRRRPDGRVYEGDGIGQKMSPPNHPPPGSTIDPPMRYEYGQKISSALRASSLAVKYGHTLAREHVVLRSSMSWICTEGVGMQMRGS